MTFAEACSSYLNDPRTRGRLKPSTLRAYRKDLAAAGAVLPQLLNTRATELIEQGQRLEITQRVLGHRDPRSTQGYAELAEAQVRAALECQAS